LIQLPNELVHTQVDFVADRAHGIQGLSGRVLEVPVEIPLAGDHRTLVAAAHRDHEIGLLGQLAGEGGWDAVGEVDAELVDDFDDFGMHVFCRGRARGQGSVSSVSGPREQGLAHLGAPGVLAADEEDRAHEGWGTTTAAASAGWISG
jgi:hypothetical protein